MENIEEKSIKELDLESTLLRLQLLKIEKEINKRKERERRVTRGLKDRKGRAIRIGDRVKLLTKSTKTLRSQVNNSPKSLALPTTEQELC